MPDDRGLTPSQTVGPFLHLALADPAARHAVGRRRARRDLDRRHGGRRQRRPGARRRRRDVADRRPVHPLRHRPPMAAGRSARSSRRRSPPATAPRRRRTWSCRCSPAGCSTVSSPACTSATRPQPTPATRRSPSSTPTAATVSSPSPRHLASTVSTSACRVPMSRSSSPSDPDPFGFLVARGPVAAATSARAWVQAMLDAEAALAAAQADAGDIPAVAAAAIAEVCVAERFDLDELFAEAALGGNPVIAARATAARAGRSGAGRARPSRRDEPGHRRRGDHDRRPALRRGRGRRAADGVEGRRRAGGGPRRRADDQPDARAVRRTNDVQHGHGALDRRPRRGARSR